MEVEDILEYKIIIEDEEEESGGTQVHKYNKQTDGYSHCSTGGIKTRVIQDSTQDSNSNSI